MNAVELYRRVSRGLESNVPPGIPPEYLQDFLARHASIFTAALAQRLAALCGPDKLVDGYERVLGINTEPGANGLLNTFLVGLKARCNPGNPALRQYAVHWRYDGALKFRGERWTRVIAKTVYADQPWKLWVGSSWDDASWNEEEAIRRFIENDPSTLWWLEGRAAVGPAADQDPRLEERTQLTDPFAVNYARHWRDLAPQVVSDPDALQHMRDQRETEARADWWRLRALPDLAPSVQVEPVQQRLELRALSRAQPRSERLPAWKDQDSRFLEDRCPDCDDRGWYHDGEGALIRCTYCGRYDSDPAMAEAHFDLGCDQCSWPAGGQEDHSGSAVLPSSAHPALGHRARLLEDWYDALTWKHTFPAGLSGTIVDVDARGRAELNFDRPLPMTWQRHDEDPGDLEGIFVPLSVLYVEGTP